MIFSEIYGSYYNTVSEILTRAIGNRMSLSEIRKLVEEKAFGESILTIPDELSSTGRWPLLDSDGYSVLNKVPDIPVSTLQKRWLKAILLDPRISLFLPNMAGLEDVEPLFTMDMIVKYDQYNDGDPYDDPQYIKCFRQIIAAIENKQKVMISYWSKTGKELQIHCHPMYIEYSEKDDKFRLISNSDKSYAILNMAKISKVEAEGNSDIDNENAMLEKRSVVLLLKDERQALERAMLHFSDYEKVTEQLDDNKYRITLSYEKSEETEVLIRVLMFGPKVKVVGPEEFVEGLRYRLKKQNNA